MADPAAGRVRGRGRRRERVARSGSTRHTQRVVERRQIGERVFDLGDDLGDEPNVTVRERGAFPDRPCRNVGNVRVRDRPVRSVAASQRNSGDVRVRGRGRRAGARRRPAETPASPAASTRRSRRPRPRTRRLRGKPTGPRAGSTVRIIARQRGKSRHRRRCHADRPWGRIVQGRSRGTHRRGCHADRPRGRIVQGGSRGAAADATRIVRGEVVSGQPPRPTKRPGRRRGVDATRVRYRPGRRPRRGG